MALKNGSSAGVDCVDVKYVLAAFQEMNKCVLLVRLSVSGTASRPVMDLEVIADPRESVAAEPASLGSVKTVIGSYGPQAMEAAILQALYSLDAQLAESEFARAMGK